MSEPLREYRKQVAKDLSAHCGEWDAVVCAGDMHGVALATVVAEEFDLPLMIVCARAFDHVVSSIVTIGKVSPTMRFLYVDDFFSFGASLAHVFKYMNQSRPARIVATYEAETRDYNSVHGIGTFGTDSNGSVTWDAS